MCPPPGPRSERVDRVRSFVYLIEPSFYDIDVWKKAFCSLRVLVLLHVWLSVGPQYLHHANILLRPGLHKGAATWVNNSFFFLFPPVLPNRLHSYYLVHNNQFATIDSMNRMLSTALKACNNIFYSSRVVSKLSPFDFKHWQKCQQQQKDHILLMSSSSIYSIYSKYSKKYFGLYLSIPSSTGCLPLRPMFWAWVLKQMWRIKFC